MLELLKAAAAISGESGLENLPDDILTFTLEYGTPPDIATERARIAELLEGNGFDLFHYSQADDPEILILQFQGIRRQQSPGFLFETAGALAEALGIDAVTPEIDVPWRDIETSGPQPKGAGTEGLGDIVWRWCSSSAPSPADPDWARKAVKADVAAATFGADGAGILIAQPDTGVARHLEIDEGVDKAHGFNLIDNVADPTDPLSPSMGSPGHGTATSSQVISRSSHVITGTAPGATLIPYRCVNKVIIGLGVAVARAIDRARHSGCHIITMSFGGPLEGSVLRRAIRRAVEADMIVLAAAGNCVRFVTYPAWDENVIAVAAIDHQLNRWKGSSHGRKVDIAAPGENVHVARRYATGSGDDGNIGHIDDRGQGTSFAVALTAGVAALWLQHHGVDNVHTAARDKNISVHALFRAAMKVTAHNHGNWDTSDMGAGVVDADKLLRLALADIPAPTVPRSANPALAFFGNLFGRNSTEAGFVAFDWQLRSSSGRAAGLETPVAAVPSSWLSAMMDGRTPPDFPSPASIGGPATAQLSMQATLKKLANIQGAGKGLDEKSARRHIEQQGPQAILDEAKATLDQMRNARPEMVSEKLQGRALESMEKSIIAISRPGPATDTTNHEIQADVEALTRLIGRPVLRVASPTAMIDAANTGLWSKQILGGDANWRKFSDAVGRIDVWIKEKWMHAGTGFLIENGMVMTNRHVLDIFGEPIPLPGGLQRFVLVREASIIFDATAQNEGKRFKIKSVITAGGARIGGLVDMNKLDMAVLEIESSNAAGNAHPDAINKLASSTGDDDIKNIMLVGYPAAPDVPADQEDDNDNGLIWDRVGEIFGDEYGIKYLSPGRIMKRPGGLLADPRNWAFSHDASTLAGNSGSVVMTLHEDYNFCGIHFGGSMLTENLAHDIKAVAAGGDGVFDEALLSSA